MSAVAPLRPAPSSRGRRRILAVYQITRITQQLRRRNMLRELRAQESFIRGIFKKATHQIRHTWQQFAHWRIFAYPIAHLDECALDRPGHSGEQLKLETAAIDPELFRQRLRMRDAADIVGAERGSHDRFVLEQNAAEPFEIGIALGFLQPYRNDPAVLGGLNF